MDQSRILVPYFLIWITIPLMPKRKLALLYHYMRNFCNLIGLERWYFSLIWNTYMWKLQTFCDISKLSQISLAYGLVKLRSTILKYHSWYLCQISLQIMLLPILMVHMYSFTTVKEIHLLPSDTLVIILVWYVIIGHESLCLYVLYTIV